MINNPLVQFTYIMFFLVRSRESSTGPLVNITKKARILTRESVTFLLPFSHSYRRTAFRFHYGRPMVFYFYITACLTRSQFFLLPAGFVCIFYHRSYAARKQCHRGHRINSQLFALRRQ